MGIFSDSNLADSSKTLFEKKIDQFITFMPSGKQNIDFIVDNPEQSIKFLNEEESIAQTSANRHMFISAIVAFLKHTKEGSIRSLRIKQKWEKIQQENWEERRQKQLNNEPNELLGQIGWKDIIKMRNQLPPGSDERLLLSLYTYIPPVRADYFDVRINPPQSIITSKKANFITIKASASESELVLRDFKTAGKYKEIKHILPQLLYDEIQLSLKAKPRNYLFVMPSDPTKPYDRGSFSKWANKTLKHLFQVPITLTSLRHLFISTLDFTNTRAKELENIGKSMGHSLAMQKGYQWIKTPNE